MRCLGTVVTAAAIVAGFSPRSAVPPVISTLRATRPACMITKNDRGFKPGRSSSEAAVESGDSPVPAHERTPERVVQHPSPSGRVLIAYTGGTLGMIKTNASWAPPQHQRGSLSELIAAMVEFHDESMPDIDMVRHGRIGLRQPHAQPRARHPHAFRTHYPHATSPHDPRTSRRVCSRRTGWEGGRGLGNGGTGVSCI